VTRQTTCLPTQGQAGFAKRRVVPLKIKEGKKRMNAHKKTNAETGGGTEAISEKSLEKLCSQVRHVEGREIHVSQGKR